MPKECFDWTVHGECIFLDEAWFSLMKRKRRGHNIIGCHAIVEVPGHHGGNVDICAYISNHGLLHCHVNLWPSSTDHYQ
ncbi:hypothetical protein P4O66_013454 [Electrophorus voltai]|uniref:Uncharacterized protein n=1 Tax=Electrophorus voltai TaxID=2609070 RepID=A0AAD8Z1S5_9TELE|nr:hypothetical protein P4O66_013454 [Electrophorus voltai]